MLSLCPTGARDYGLEIFQKVTTIVVRIAAAIPKAIHSEAVIGPP
jgi:hypothetical protein